MKPLCRMQQARKIIVFSFYIPLFPSEEANECSSYDVNLNQVAVVCNLIFQLATSKQTAENTSDRDVKTKQPFLLLSLPVDVLTACTLHTDMLPGLGVKLLM